MKNRLSVCIFIAVMVGCNEQQQVKAKIFERRELDSNRLMIVYAYQVNSKTYTDSAVINNDIIKEDSIKVIINSSTPQKAIPDLSR